MCLNRGEGGAEGSAEGQGEQGGTEVRLSAELQQTGSSEDVLVLVFGLLCVCVCAFDCLFEKGVEGWIGWMPLK